MASLLNHSNSSKSNVDVFSERLDAISEQIRKLKALASPLEQASDEEILPLLNKLHHMESQISFVSFTLESSRIDDINEDEMDQLLDEVITLSPTLTLPPATPKASASTATNTLSPRTNNLSIFITRHRTTSGLDEEDDVAFYDVGSGIHNIGQSVMSRQFAKDVKQDKTYSEQFAEHKSHFYFWSTVAHICRADGILGDKEEEYIRKYGVNRMSQKHSDEVMEGKDCSEDFVKTFDEFCKEIAPKDSEMERQRYMRGMKQWLLLCSVAAATQDGLAKEEYEKCKALAGKLGLKLRDVKRHIETLKSEQRLANRVSTIFF